MRIGELAELTATAVETIRYYEHEGLLPAAPRTAANYRQYGAAHAERLRLIRRCRALDMNLAEVRHLLALSDAPGDDCHEVDALLDQHIGHVQQRIHELQLLQTELLALRQRCAPGLAGCGIVQGLREGDPAVQARGVHSR